MLMSAPATNVDAGADQHDGVGTPDRRSPRATASSMRLPHAGAQRVDRRVVDGQDRDAVLDFVVHEIQT